MRRTLRLVILALGGLRRTPLRVVLTSLGVAIASAALVSMVAFALGLQRQVEAPLKLLALLNDIHVSPKEGKQTTGSFALDDAAVERFAQMPGVSAAFPNIRVRGMRIRRGDKSETCLGVAVPREASLLGVTNEILVAGRFFADNREPEVIIGQQLSRQLGYETPQEAVGATLALEAAGMSPAEEKTYALSRTRLEVQVVGVYELPPLVPPTARTGVLVPLDLMKTVPGIHFESAIARLKTGRGSSADVYSSVTVRVRDPADLDAVEAAIRQQGFQTRTMLSRFGEMRTFFLFLQVVLAAVGTVALVVAGLGIANTLLMAVLERYQEIGVCKAIGATDGDIMVLFLSEAGMIGLLGGLGGLALGRTVSYGLELAVNAYAQAQGVTKPVEVFAFPLWLLAAALGFAILASLLAAIYPAWRAARVDPIRALRGL